MKLAPSPPAAAARRPWLLPVVLSIILLALAAAAGAVYLFLGRRAPADPTSAGGVAVGAGRVDAGVAAVGDRSRSTDVARHADAASTPSGELPGDAGAPAAEDAAPERPADAAAAPDARRTRLKSSAALKALAEGSKPARVEKKAPREGRGKAAGAGGASRKPKKGEGKSKDGGTAKAKLGYLIVASRPSAKVLVDGRATGLKTPVPPASPLKLPAGRHKITLVVGAQKFSFTVEIRPGQTSKLAQILPVAP